MSGPVSSNRVVTRWMLVALMMCTAVLGACGDPEASVVPQADTTPAGEIPTRLDIVCHEDGSTELLNDEVQASADGVHIRVDNRAGEFVSLNGAGLDFSEGLTEQIARSAPGELKVACWPGSKHTDPEPERLAIQIYDPGDYWIPAELECPKDEGIAGSTLDYAAGSTGDRGDPRELAERVKGIEPGDEIITVGYPQSEYRRVAVERRGETIAILSYFPAEEGGWLLGGYSACGSAGISV